MCPGLLSSHNAADSLLILIRQAGGQEFLLEELYPELGGSGLKVLVLFLGSFVVKECSFGRGERGLAIPQWWARCWMQWEVTIAPDNFLKTRLHRIFLLNQRVRVGE